MSMKFKMLALAAASMLAVASPAAAQTPKAAYGSWGLELKDMDPSAKPGDGFFQYAEGSWLRNHPIPSDKSSAGYNSELPDEIELQVRKMVEAVSAHPDHADRAQDRGCLSCLDGRGRDRGARHRAAEALRRAHRTRSKTVTSS